MNLLNLPQKINECDDFKIIMLPPVNTKQGVYTEYRIINKSNRYTTKEIMEAIINDLRTFLSNIK